MATSKSPFEIVEPFLVKYGAGKLFNQLAVRFPDRVMEEEKLIVNFSRNNDEKIMELAINLMYSEGQEVVIEQLESIQELSLSTSSDLPFFETTDDESIRFSTPVSSNTSTPDPSKKKNVRFSVCKNCPVLQDEITELKQEIDRNWKLIRSQNEEIDLADKRRDKTRTEFQIRLKTAEDCIETAHTIANEQRNEIAKRDDLLTERAREIGKIQAQLFEQNREINSLRAQVATFEQRNREQMSASYIPMSSPEVSVGARKKEPVYVNEHQYEEIIEPSQQSPDIFWRPERTATPFPRNVTYTTPTFNQVMDMSIASSSTFGTISPFYGDGRTSFTTWLKEFENISQCFHWDAETTITHLIVRFKGAALDHYSQFTATQKRDYRYIVDEMKIRFDTPESTLVYESELFNLKRKSNELPQVFANKLKELFNKANPIVATNEIERNCYRKVQEKQIIKLFTTKINDREMEKRLHYDGPATLNEAIEIAMKQFNVNKLMSERQYVNVIAEVHQEADTPIPHREQRGNQPRKICPTCGKIGHTADNCYSKHTCEECGRLGHTKTLCWKNNQCKYCSRTGHSPTSCPRRSEITCPFCKEKGHYQLECPKFKSEAKPICDFCGGLGHQHENCLKRNEAQLSENSKFSTKAGPSSVNI